MKNVQFIIVFYSLLHGALNAQNLVPNHSFENIDSCSMLLGGGVNLAQPWISPTISTPDLYASCFMSPFVSVPYNGWGYQPAKDGSAYAGIYVYNSGSKNERDFVQVKLDSSLKACTLYRVQFYVNVVNISRYTVATIGAYFSDSAIYGNSFKLLPYKPQVNHDKTKKLSDTASWIPVTGTFMAKGGERYLTIGNFNTDSTSNVDSIAGNTYPGGYYFIDDVSVTEQLTLQQANAGNDTYICLGANTAIGIYFDTTGIKINWQPATSLSDNTIPQPTAMPAVSTTYTLTLSYACGYTSTATVTVFVVNKPTVTVTLSDTALCTGKTATAHALVSGGSPYTYSWSGGVPGSGFEVSGLVAGVYTVTVTNTYGCTATTITVIKPNPPCVCEEDIFIPNVFSPNNDGKNDVLYIQGNGLTNIYWGIYDRWGNLVFEAYDNTHSWDGTKKGNPVEAGVYSYYLRGICVKTNMEYNIKGNIGLIK